MSRRSREARARPGASGWRRGRPLRQILVAAGCYAVAGILVSGLTLRGPPPQEPRLLVGAVFAAVVLLVLGTIVLFVRFPSGDPSARGR